MATKVIMPKAGMAMEEGVIVTWLKKVGDVVKTGEPIAEIETDKAIMELEAEVSGVLIALLRNPGDHVKVTEAIAWIGTAGEVPPEEVSAAGSARIEAQALSTASVARGQTAAASKIAATPAARRLAGEAGLDIARVELPASGAIHAEDVRSHIRKNATALASRMAEAAGIDPASLSGPDGSRARKSDAASAIAQSLGTGRAPRAEASSPEPSFAPATTPRLGEDRRIPFTAIQRITGERLRRSAAEIPAVTVFAVADATRFLATRESINTTGGLKISVNDLLIRATAKALVANPRANAVLDGDALILKAGIHVGVAVATDSGLVVPTLRDADRLSLTEISLRARDLAERARARRLRPDELEGGSFTISNIGMYGVTGFTPIINQPQVGILGIGAIEERLALDATGIPVARRVLHLSFTFDHRALDGAEAATFIKAVKDLIEEPLLILI